MALRQRCEPPRVFASHPFLERSLRQILAVSVIVCKFIHATCEGGDAPLSSAEAPYGKLIILVLGGCAGNDRQTDRRVYLESYTINNIEGREPRPLFSLSPSRHSARAAVFSLASGLRPRNRYGQSSTKEDSAEERGDAPQVTDIFNVAFELNFG